MKNPFGEQRQQEHLRLIPQIDKSPRLQAMAATVAGRFVLTLIFLLVLWSFGKNGGYLQFSWLELAAILGLGVLPGPILPKLFAGSLLVFFSGLKSDFGSMASRSDQASLAHELFLKFSDRIAVAPLFYFAGALALFLVLTWICLHILRRLGTSTPAIWLFLVWSALMALALNLSPDTVASSLLWLTVGVFSLCIFSIAYFYSSRPAPKDARFLNWATFSLQTLFVAPPFTVIRHPDRLVHKKPSMSLAVCQLKALKLLVWSRLLFVIERFVSYVVFTKWGWVHFNQIGMVEYNAHHLIWYQVLITRLTQTLIFLLHLSVTTGVGISIFRLAGVYLPRAVCRPYLARSFNDYFRRCLFYYSEMILYLFFYPFYEKIYSLVKRRSWRVQISLFASLVTGGLIFHIVIAWQSFFFFGAAASLKNAAGWLPYFALIALSCCFSATGWLSGKMREAPLALHLALNFLLHALLMSFLQYSLGATFTDRMNFIRSMWPL